MKGVIFLVIVLMSTYVQAQDSKQIRSIIATAKQYQTSGKSSKAIKTITKGLQKYQDDENLMQAMASLYLDMDDESQALVWLNKTIQVHNPQSPRLYYTLYRIYRNQSKSDSAMLYLKQSYDFIPSDDKKRDVVKREIQNYAFVVDAMANPVPFEPQLLSDRINTSDLEYLPSITADGTMIFTRRVGGQEDLYQASLDTTTTDVASPLTSLNTAQNEGAHCISADGNTLIVSLDGRRDSYGGFDLYYSRKLADGWSEPKNLGKSINSNAWDAQPSLSADGTALYFASSRKGGVGGKDIYVSHLVNKRWQSAQPLDTLINTKGDEASPYFHPDGQSLYFRSNGHVGMGDFDIYLSRKEHKDWSTPTNLGYPINTEGSEGALFVDVFGEKAYYASDAGRDNLDIFVFDLPQEVRPQPVTYVQVEVLDALTDQPIDATIELTSDTTHINLSTDQSGNLLYVLSAHSDYALTVERDGYLFHSEHIFTRDANQASEPYQYTIRLQPIPTKAVVEEKKPEPVILNNIFFESGSHTLLQASDYEVTKLANLLTENADMHITIIGHTDNVGNEADNVTLSQRRANAVKEALVRKGIAATRIKSTGYGESRPIATNDTPEGRRKNRRTEFVID